MPKTLIDLVNHLKQSGVLKSALIIEAFLKIDRKNFVPEEWQSEAYEDHPLPLQLGQTISQPWTVAFMLELLQPQPGQNILDIGFGSGWTSALLAYIVSKSQTGTVFAIEIIPEVFNFGKKNIEKYNFIEKEIIKVYCQDGSKGLPQEAPFNRILVSAAAPTIPETLLEQLEIDGVLVIPDDYGIYQIKKTPTGFKKNYFKGFAFVPLQITKNNKGYNTNEH
jgi:protein-L-isoaspartate(D-aspartate) O-methyltransferase